MVSHAKSARNFPDAALLKEIIEDIDIMMKQYGPLIDHKNQKATSRFLAPVGVSGLLHNNHLSTFSQVFNRIIPLFGLLINNSPESTMPGRIKTKGCIECQFRVFRRLIHISEMHHIQNGCWYDRILLLSANSNVKTRR
jgi:hypothetical protein